MKAHVFVFALAALTLSCCKTVRKSPEPQSRTEVPGSQASAAAPLTQGAETENAATPSGTATPSAAAAAGLVLKKVVGALSKQDPKEQHYECGVTLAELAQPEQVKQWIAAVAKAPIVEALHFRATIPSIQIFAYHEGQEILVFESYSKARYRRPLDENAIKNEAAEELMKIANQKCAYP